MDKIFIFPDPEKKYYYLLIFLFCSLIRKLVPRIISYYRGKDFNFIPDDLEKMHFNKNKCCFNIFSNFLADFSAGIMILIDKYRNREKKNSSQNLIIRKEIEYRKYFFMPILATFDFIAQLSLFAFSFIVPKGKLLEKESISEEDLYFVVLIDIISRYCFSKIFLNSHFEKHHIVSIVLTCIGFIPLTLKNIIDLDLLNCENIRYIDLTLFVFMTIVYSLEDVLNKICLNQLIYRPFELMFYKSLFQIPFVFLLLIYSIKYNNLSLYISNNISVWQVLYRFSFIVCNIFRTWSLITIIELLSPNHLSVLKSSEFAILFVFQSIFNRIFNSNRDKLIYIFGTLCSIISIIGSAIHNELVIINKFGLLECTIYYKTEIKQIPEDEDLEEDSEGKNKTLDSFLGDSIDND